MIFKNLIKKKYHTFFFVDRNFFIQKYDWSNKKYKNIKNFFLLFLYRDVGVSRSVIIYCEESEYSRYEDY